MVGRRADRGGFAEWLRGLRAAGGMLIEAAMTSAALARLNIERARQATGPGRRRRRQRVKDETSKPVMVSRRIGAPAADVFRILADPRSHPGIDGSGMLRGAVSGAVISGVGDVFVMKMYYSELGDYEMNNHVVEFEPNRRIGWEPEAGRGHPDAGGAWGQRWSFELTPDGPDATIVTEIYDCSRAPEEERADMDGGTVWIESMTRTLERLDALSSGPDPAQDPGQDAVMQ
jgi:hypothetical protein